MKKKFLSILVAIAVTLSLSACQNGNTEQTVPLSDSVTTVVEETAEPIEMKTVEPPEDGWTLEELNEVLYMNGQPIDLPLMFSSLGDGYEIRDKRYNDESSSDSDIVGGYLYYKDELIALVTFYELENDIEFLKLYFFPDIYESFQNSIAYININGFGLHNNIDEIHRFLGSDYQNEHELLIYDVKYSNYSITIPNTKEFWISLEVKNKESNKNE